MGRRRAAIEPLQLVSAAQEAPTADPSNTKVLGSPTTYQVVFLGPMGVGKTTAVRALSDEPVVDTDVAMAPRAMSGEVAPGTKTTTTVGLDYGLWKPAPGISVALIGTPGQGRFASVRATILAPRSRAVLWLADGPEAPDQADEWLDMIGERGVNSLVIALNRFEASDKPCDGTEELLRERLSARGLTSIPVRPADPRDRMSVMDVVSAALDLTEESR